jgi:tetratricopeptide (TPR) repeat protein
MRNIIPVTILAAILFSGCQQPKVHKTSSGKEIIDSVVFLTDLIKNDSLDYSLFARRASNYLERGNIDQSLRDIQQALKLNPENPDLFVLLADIYLILGQVENSIMSLKKAAKLEPDNIIPALKLSEMYHMMEQIDIALRYADEAIAIDRQNAEGYYMKAVALLAKGDTVNALNNFRISNNYDSLNYMTNMQLGATYTAMNDTVAEEYFIKALKIAPGDERALFYLAMHYQDNRQFENSIDTYQQVIELYPENKRAFYNMGYVYLVELGDFDNAQIMFEKAIELSPGFVEAVYNLGRAKEAAGDLNGARVQYRKALEILPNYPLAVQSLNRLDDIQIRKSKD